MLHLVSLLTPAVFAGLCIALVPVGVVSTLGAIRHWSSADRLLVAVPSGVLAAASTTVAVVGLLQRDPNAMCGLMGLCPVGPVGPTLQLGALGG